MQRWCGLLLAASLPCIGGCAFYPRAQNPLPGVYRVAVVDFVDKTNGAEGVDTAVITEIFASELQKIPTYEVVPVQEVREILGPVRIDTNQPQIAFEIARAVHAQAIIVGAVTEYNAYYPPRVGLHCEMYAMVTGQPEAIVQSPPAEMERPGGFAGVAGIFAHGPHSKGNGEPKHSHGKCGKGWWKRRCETNIQAPLDVQGVIDAPEESPIPIEPIRFQTAMDYSPSNLPPEGVVAARERVADGQKSSAGGAKHAPASKDPFGDDEDWGPSVRPAGLADEERAASAEDFLTGHVSDYRISVVPASDPVPIVEPWVIRHSRVFDSTNHGLTRKLKDYYYFTDDLRGGNWQGYVLRNDDFTRFACNQMIYEMLAAAGGDWMTLFGVRYAKPWEPWPPR